MFKFNFKRKPRKLEDFINPVNEIDYVTQFTAFVYPKIHNRNSLKPSVSRYEYFPDVNEWRFVVAVTWDIYQCSKRLLTT